MKLYKSLYVPMLNFIGLMSYPFLLLKDRKNERLGLNYPNLGESIWIHASSVGEVNAIKPLLNKLLLKYPAKNFLITTMTTTGKSTAIKISARLNVRLIPIDIPFLINKIIESINPKILIIAETELWPALINQSKLNGIPVIISNGRLSDRSFPKYLRLKSLLKTLTFSVTEIITQSIVDVDRFKQLGFNKVMNGGNLKFSIDLPAVDVNSIRNELKIDDTELVISFGSSRPGEEKLILECYNVLKQKYSNLKLIIVPRHLNRIDSLKETLFQNNASFYTDKDFTKDILIIDAMGVLTNIYAISDITIVGGSFFDFGGHNPLEPAFYSKPVVIGDFHSSCRDSVKQLKKNNAVVVSNQHKLLQDLTVLLAASDKRRTLGINAKKTLDENSKALENNFNIIKSYLK